MHGEARQASQAGRIHNSADTPGISNSSALLTKCGAGCQHNVVLFMSLGGGCVAFGCGEVHLGHQNVG